MTGRSARERLREAAFALFEEEGYDATTVDEIAERAGVGRATFFRTFGSKEDVIFPEHDEVLARIRARFAGTSAASLPLTVTEAARLVLRHYLDEGDLARSRYRLTRSVPALRHREIAMMQQYQRAFRDSVLVWQDDELAAELLAAAVVTAHNYVLRRWLRGLTDAPEAEFDDAMAVVLARFGEAGDTDDAQVPAGGATALLVVRSDADLAEVARLVAGRAAGDAG